MEEKRIKIFTGHFGSGKTEISINYALKLAAQKKKTCIVDFDVVTPYFCVRDQKLKLESMGIMVISPSIDITTSELTTVPSNIMAAFDNRNYNVVFDVGGDDKGAVALGQYNRYFMNEPYEMYFVINSNRPFTSDINGILEYIDRIQNASRLKITYLVNNTNMSYETQVEDIIKGQEIIGIVSSTLNIPIKYTCITEDLVQKLPDNIEGDILKLKIFMRPKWLE